MPRFHVPIELQAGQALSLPSGAVRHVQVLRLQPADEVTLFNGMGGEWRATILRMGRGEVLARVDAHDPIEREAARAVHLAVGLMATERMEWLIEKATELGMDRLTPVLTVRGNVRLGGERADRKLRRWQAVAAAACEQCGRNRMPEIHEPRSLRELLQDPGAGERWLLTLAPATSGLQDKARVLPATTPVTLLSGPEGGLDPHEESLAREAGFAPSSLGARVLRAETAPLAALACLTTP